MNLTLKKEEKIIRQIKEKIQYKKRSKTSLYIKEFNKIRHNKYEIVLVNKFDEEVERKIIRNLQALTRYLRDQKFDLNVVNLYKED